MFRATYIYELQLWAKQSSVYIFAFFLCLLPMAQMAEWAGVLAGSAAEDGTSVVANSAIRIWSLFNKFSILTLFLLPVIFGQSIQRDYRQNVHDLLYSYPLQKGKYLIAKYLSALTVVMIILFFMGLGTHVGTILPGRDSSLVHDFSLTAYLDIYGTYLLPNVLLLGSFIFVVVLLTRNVYAGFVTVLLFYFLQMGVSELILNDEITKTQALLDPFGNRAVQYFTQNWALEQQNKLPFPVSSLLICNRVIWLLIATGLLAVTYRLFSFDKEPSQFFSGLVSGPKSNRTQGFEELNVSYNHIVADPLELTKVNFDYSFMQNVKACIFLTKFHLSYVLKNGAFISILLAGIAIVIFKQAEVTPAYGEATLPVTWKMLQFPLHNFSGTINILTYLFMGMLIHRGRSVQANFLTDTASMPNWVHLFSNFMAIIGMQVILLSIVMIGGIAVQCYYGYYDFNITHYLFELFVLNFIHFFIAACLATFVQTLIPNPYLGFFLLLIAMIGFAHTQIIGLPHNIFRYNWGPNYYYSDILKYGNSLTLYLLYKFYWLLGGVILLILSHALWIRGVPSIQDRLMLFGTRLKGKGGFWLAVLCIGFLSLGSCIWYEDQVLQSRWTIDHTDMVNQKVQSTFIPYENLPQPSVRYAQFWMEIYPDEQDFNLRGTYHLINETSIAIDTLLIIAPLGHDIDYIIEEPHDLLFTDTTIIRDRYAMDFTAIRLANELAPNDSLSFQFTMQNPANSFLRKNSPVQKNMTQFVPPTIPRIGYRDIGTISLPSDSLASTQMYETSQSDYLQFETTITTSSKQIGIAPGTLVDQRTENVRSYYRYKTSYPAPLYLSFISGAFQIKKDKWKDIDLEIYYHEGHHHNLKDLMEGMKQALNYNSANFGDYPLDLTRLVEYPLRYGKGGKAFYGLCSISEFAFIAKVDDDPTAANYPFFLAAHEVAHQWWMHQLNPANALGAEMILESLCQYTALKCIEHAKGKEQLRAFLEDQLRSYKNGVKVNSEKETPLMYNQGDSHITYAKGALVFYVLSQELGEHNLNTAIKNFFQKFKGDRKRFARSIDLVDEIRKVASDDQQVLITDLFEKPGFRSDLITLN